MLHGHCADATHSAFVSLSHRQGAELVLHGRGESSQSCKAVHHPLQEVLASTQLDEWAALGYGNVGVGSATQQSRALAPFLLPNCVTWGKLPEVSAPPCVELPCVSPSVNMDTGTPTHWCCQDEMEARFSGSYLPNHDYGWWWWCCSVA